MRMAALAPRSALDVGLAVVGVALAEVAAWVTPNPVGTPIAGPTWFVAVFPLLLAAPLAWRRSYPLLAWTLVMGAVVVQALTTADSPEGLEILFVLGVGGYSVAAYSDRRRALVGLGVAVAGYAIYALENRDVTSGRTSDEWAGSFFGVALIALWLLGVFVRNRQQERLLTARAEAIERGARVAVAEERARLARELHDVVSHNLSVVVVQAAGARASGAVNASTLEKIERSGRESLVEMRRLLGVLRSDGEDPALAPQPGVADIEALAEQVRAAGLPVEVTVEGDCRDLPPAIDLSAYRIVQEALTNVLRHAGPARAVVTIRCDRHAVTIDVDDDGCGASSESTNAGHGLIGVRERVALFGGELIVGPRPTGGFAVSARLMRDGWSP
ncbi:MAG: sensor histidine kinase [Jatrophihabitantaceae bacterium]